MRVIIALALIAPPVFQLLEQPWSLLCVALSLIVINDVDKKIMAWVAN